MKQFDHSAETLTVAVRELRAEVRELAESPGSEPLTDVLAHWLTAHYAGAARREAANATDSVVNLKTLRGLTADVAALRRGDQYAERLAIEREWLELERREKIEAGLDALYQEIKSVPGAKNVFTALSRLVKRGSESGDTDDPPTVERSGAEGIQQN